MSNNRAIRDEIARELKWIWVVESDRSCWINDNGDESDEHPIPDTLEEAAKMPKGWTWFRMANRGRGDLEWSAMAAGNEPKTLQEVYISDTGDEKPDRFALRLAAIRAMKGKT